MMRNFFIAALFLPAMVVFSGTASAWTVACQWSAVQKSNGLLILGQHWVLGGTAQQNIQSTKAKAAQCVHTAITDITDPVPCPGEIMGLQQGQRWAPCN